MRPHPARILVLSTASLLLPAVAYAQGDFIMGGRLYDKWWADMALPTPTSDHPLWQTRPDQVSNIRTGADTWRCKECHGWDYKGVDGQYGSGSHRTGFPGILGTSLSDAELFTLLNEQPTISGGSVVNGHDYGSVLPAVAIDDLIAFIRQGIIDDSLYIDGVGDFLGDSVQGGIFYTGLGGCRICHGNFGRRINFKTPQNPEYVGTVALENPWELLHKIRFGSAGASMPIWLQFGGDDQGAADIGRYAQLNLCPWAADGDMDGDGDADGDDIQWFVDAVIGGSTDPADMCPGDFDGNEFLDFYDVSSMVNVLLSQ